MTKPTLTIVTSLKSNKFSFSAMVVKIHPCSKKHSTYLSRATGPKLIIVLPYKILLKWGQSTCQYYKYIFGSYRPVLTELFPCRGLSKYFKGFHFSLIV